MCFWTQQGCCCPACQQRGTAQSSPGNDYDRTKVHGPPEDRRRTPAAASTISTDPYTRYRPADSVARGSGTAFLSVPETKGGRALRQSSRERFPASVVFSPGATSTTCAYSLAPGAVATTCPSSDTTTNATLPASPVRGWDVKFVRVGITETMDGPTLANSGRCALSIGTEPAATSRSACPHTACPTFMVFPPPALDTRWSGPMADWTIGTARTNPRDAATAAPTAALRWRRRRAVPVWAALLTRFGSAPTVVAVSRQYCRS